MKILLVAVNAKYIHSNPAIYSLKAYAEKYVDAEIGLAEYTINQQPDEVLKSIFRKSPELLCFSCYIWNLIFVEGLVRELAKLLPDVEIWMGGPEVSYDGREVLGRLPQVRGIMKGEGEATFASLCGIYAGSAPAMGLLARTEGITFRDHEGVIHENPWREPVAMDTLPFIYSEEMSRPPCSGEKDEAHALQGGRLREFEHKIIYYETSRGCPFSCSYCLSSVDKRLRFRSISLVKRELQFFLDHRVPQVKFVDRTFNCRHGHAMEIWRYIAGHDNGITNFHFEVAADLFTEDELLLIESMRPGLIQLEIGVQSVNPATIREIRRKMDFGKVREHVLRIAKKENVHQHLDLIAGLPYEDMGSFAHSFDQVYALRPGELQLGFLKVLKGSYMRENEKSYGLVYKSLPPYEVLRTKWLSYEDLLELKGVEEMVEVYYNSGQFSHAMEVLNDGYASPFQMYLDLSRYYERRHYDDVRHKRSARYEILLAFTEENFPHKAEIMREYLVYDYYLRENAKSRPEFAGEYKVSGEFLRSFYEEESRAHKYLPGYESYDRSQMRKMTHIEYFPGLRKMLLFDYKCRNPLNQNARTCMIERDSEERGTGVQ